MKKILLMTIGMSVCSYSFAQKPQAPKPGKIFFTSFIGLAKVSGKLSAKASSGFQAMTGVAYKFDRHHSLTGELSFDGYAYEETTPTFSLSGTMNIIPLTVLYKYTFGKNKWLPFLKAGVGASRFSVPAVSEKNSYTTIRNLNAYSMQAQLAVGLTYVIKPQYLVFTEAAYQQFGKIALLNNQRLKVNSFRVGVSTAL